MPPRRRSTGEVVETFRAPARDPKERENQLIEAAIDEAERQIRAGEASAQVITHFLKLGSSREILEQTRIEHEIKMLDAKRSELESQQRLDELVGDALEAFRQYSGNAPKEVEAGYDD